MKKILLIYRGIVFDTEIKPRLNQFKKDDITLITENKLTQKIINHLIKDYKQKIQVLTFDDFFKIDTKLNYMEFDVILMNPAYQNGKDKFFYTKFIRKAFTLLKYNGILESINPFAWIGSNRKIFKEMCNDGYFHHIEQKDSKKLFNVDLNAPLSFFIYEKGCDKRGHSDIIYINEDKVDSLALDIYDKIMKDSIKPIKGKNQQKTDSKPNGFIENKTNDYKYPVYLSSAPERKNMWSIQKERGYGISKLVVSHILEPYKSEYYTEYNKDKGVGRYSVYFECNEMQSKNICAFFDSIIYEFIDKLKRYGRYAHIEIPNIDWSLSWNVDSIYKKLTKEEIDYIQKYVG